VIANLVDNGVAAGGPVDVRARVERSRLAIDVRDRGPGVPAGDRDRIFEPFFTSKTQGTGLGLAISRRIVELHGGTIVVRDAADGPGAVFHLEIPR
jgi:two-component system sensor histidine kinase HydH